MIHKILIMASEQSPPIQSDSDAFAPLCCETLNAIHRRVILIIITRIYKLSTVECIWCSVSYIRRVVQVWALPCNRRYRLRKFATILWTFFVCYCSCYTTFSNRYSKHNEFHFHQENFYFSQQAAAAARMTMYSIIIIALMKCSIYLFVTSDVMATNLADIYVYSYW